MWNDVVDLRDFYATPLGQAARHFIGQQARSLWPDLRGRRLLGFGYATPYLGAFRAEALCTIAAMPAGQGALPWPQGTRGLTLLADETQLPFPERSFDRILLIHALEFGEPPREMLREVWRLLGDDGRLLVVAPARRGLWSRSERTPFGQGEPYSMSQLTRLLRDSLFTPLVTVRALYLPPIASPAPSSPGPALVPAIRGRADDRGRQGDLCGCAPEPAPAAAHRPAARPCAGMKPA